MTAKAKAGPLTQTATYLVSAAVAACLLIVFRGYLLGYSDEGKVPRDSLMSDVAGGLRNLTQDELEFDEVKGIKRLLFSQREPVDNNLKATGFVTQDHYLRRHGHIAEDAGWAAVEELRAKLIRRQSVGEFLNEVGRSLPIGDFKTATGEALTLGVGLEQVARWLGVAEVQLDRPRTLPIETIMETIETYRSWRKYVWTDPPPRRERDKD